MTELEGAFAERPATTERRTYVALLNDVQAVQGELHPVIADMPYEARVELLRQAKEDGVVLGKAEIDAHLQELDERIAVVRRLAALLNRSTQ